MSANVPLLARLGAAVVLGDWEELQRLRRSAEPDRTWRETLLQSFLFAGFPRVVEAFRILNQAGGVGLAGPEEADLEGDLEGRGREMFDKVYGEHADAVRAELQTYHYVFAGWVAKQAYGNVLSRPGLSAAERECIAVASLAALGQGRQLASHLRGGLNCGATAAELHEAIEAVADLIGEERAGLARDVASRFAPK